MNRLLPAALCCSFALTPAALAQDRAAPPAEKVPTEAEAAQSAAAALQATIPELTTLYLDAKQCHWNVTGPDFYQLHELYQEIADDLLVLTDRVAARKRQLGVPVDARAGGVADVSADLGGFPEGSLTGEEANAELHRRFLAVAENLRDRLDGGGDPVTASLLQFVSERLDHWTWFLRAHVADGGEDAED